MEHCYDFRHFCCNSYVSNSIVGSIEIALLLGEKTFDCCKTTVLCQKFKQIILQLLSISVSDNPSVSGSGA